MKWFVQKNIVNLGLAASLVILGATAGIVYRNTVRLAETAAWVARAHEVLEEIRSTLALLADAETARRGHTITGEERQPELYEAVIKKIDREAGDVRKLIADHPDPQRQINGPEALITRKLAVLNGSIRLWKNRPSDTAAQTSLADKGLRLMEDIRGTMSGTVIDLNDLLRRRVEESRANSEKIILSLFIGNPLGLALLALVFYRLHHEIAEHKREREGIPSERVAMLLPDAAEFLPVIALPPAQTIGGEAGDVNPRDDAIGKFNGALECRPVEHTAPDKNIILLGEMGGLLRTCRTLEEAYRISARCLEKLFPTESGALCVLTAPHDLAEIVAVWGNSEPARTPFSPDDCWALRRGKTHRVESHRAGLICLHVKQPLSVSFLCVPLFAQNDLLGVLHMISSVPDEFPPSGDAGLKEHLAMTAANHIALVLSNLRLRETLRGRAATNPQLFSQAS